ncbi:MAG: hypothetical protein U1E84_16650 [Rhodoferax sp.]
MDNHRNGKSAKTVLIDAGAMRVTPDTVRMLDVNFWRVDTVVMRADDDLVLPIYVAERLFAGDWRPQVGQYIAETLWLQTFAARRLGGPPHEEQV